MAASGCFRNASRGITFVIRKLDFRNSKFESGNCFGFRYSNFGFNSAPLAQLAEQVTLNCARSEVIRPALPNTLRKFRVCWVTLSNQRQDSLQNGPNVT